jgi:hypothetical protein
MQIEVILPSAGFTYDSIHMVIRILERIIGTMEGEE